MAAANLSSSRAALKNIYQCYRSKHIMGILDQETKLMVQQMPAGSQLPHRFVCFDCISATKSKRSTHLEWLAAGCTAGSSAFAALHRNAARCAAGVLRTSLRCWRTGVAIHGRNAAARYALSLRLALACSSVHTVNWCVNPSTQNVV